MYRTCDEEQGETLMSRSFVADRRRVLGPAYDGKLQAFSKLTHFRLA